MNYEEMSDIEINLEVARYLFESFEEIRPSVRGGAEIYVDSGQSKFYDFDCGLFNYCNNPSDAWPIIVNNKMKIDPRRSSPKLDWMVSRDDQIYAVDKNPLRAAMICFLKMKDAE